MAHNRTDDTARFMNAIAAFSAAPEEITVLGRLIASEGVDYVDCLLAEINETVLRRIVHFSTSSGDCLSLDVSERRIHAVRELPPALRQKFQHLLRRGLSEQDAAVFLEIVQAMGQVDSSLYARASLPEVGDAIGFDALSIRHVVAAKATAGMMTDLPDTFLAAIEETRKCVLALVAHSHETTVIRIGEETQCEALDRLSADCAAKGYESPFVRLWQGVLVAKHAALIAATGNCSVAMLVPEARLTENFALWRRAAFDADAR